MNELTPEQKEHRQVLDLLLDMMRHIVGARFSMSTTRFGRGEYRLLISSLHLHPCYAKDLDRASFAHGRVGCTHPFFDRRGIQALLASCPGLSSITESNCYHGDMEPPLWPRSAGRSKPPYTFGFDFLVDIEERAANLRDLELRLYGEARS